MLGKREDLRQPDNRSYPGDDWQEELERIYQLYQKRRPWTSNFKNFIEKELGIQIGQGVVDSKLDRKFRTEEKYLELLEIFNKKQARLASEVVGEDTSFSLSNSKLEATNTSTTVGDSQPSFFITPDKLQEQIGASQYEKLIAETFALIEGDKPSKPQESSPRPSINRRNEPLVEATVESTANLQVVLPAKDQEERSDSETPIDSSATDQLATPNGQNGFLSAQLNTLTADDEQPKLQRAPSFDLLTDTDLAGFLFQQPDYRRLRSPSRPGPTAPRADRLRRRLPLEQPNCLPNTPVLCGSSCSMLLLVIK